MQKPRNEFRFRVLWLLLMSVSTEARRVPSLLDEGGPLHFGRCQTSPSHVACRHSSLSAMAFAAATSIGSLWMPSRIRFAVRGAANPTHKQCFITILCFACVNLLLWIPRPGPE